MPEVQKPYCLAMVLCEAAHRCPTTGKWTLLGTFTRLRAPQMPIRAQFCVYFVVTDGIGDVPIGFRIVPAESLLEDDPPEATLEGPETVINFSDPLVAFEGVIGLRVELPTSGVYHCELYSGDEILMSRRLLVMASQKGNGHE